ncbi:UDP-N-acetylmuramoyl-L-alanyl-D-glutamate--2,6-diaminopimelate ligase [Caryophanon latum]|uniref:UDP-N-acetylmuramyl-tripeptide synthetase n=1 Tax=Caryophanon latum TaxID=33977 RepID=A0A1C0Z2R8_9BACL|nr:UDP-N-acetylmuramoyl-L-alanyl-D-glutamate--2,6-diaminopimelate ligase [Caryophanon latum]OCS93668.1 UDP-N-acetylmuramoyl-L-alanyl-D-glutamate--2,6-diaminopimelate ligase [Caryophanon latum]
MYAEELLSALPLKRVIGPMPTLIKDIAIDSRIVEEKSLFVCIKGDTVDGHEYAQQAVNNGAIVIVTERELVLEGDVTQVIVQDTNRAIGLLAAKFFDYPSNELTMVGVTGTNGKTSVTGIIHNLLQSMGERSALTGTIGFNLNGILYETANTTSDALSTQQMIFRAKMEGCRAMIMEVSSHGLALGRLAGVEYDVAIFTNLTHDHLDFHGTMEEYGNAKGLLFSQLGQDLSKNKVVVLNADDAWSKKYAMLTQFPIYTYGIKDETAAFRATGIRYEDGMTYFTLHSPEGNYDVSMHLLGEFNVYNMLAAIAAFYGRGYALELIVEHIAELLPVKGRMEKVQSDLPFDIFIDYAHTPDAIEKAIDAAMPYKRPGKKMIFLVGTGGGRDKTKRPAMAEKASRCEYVVLTTDDPRYEEFDSITGDLAKGMTHENFACIGDRAEAVRHAVSVAEEGDIIIFAGKGHEDYQIIENTKYPHSDTDIALEEGRKKFNL